MKTSDRDSGANGDAVEEQGLQRDSVEKRNWAAAIRRADLDEEAHRLFAAEGGTDINSLLDRTAERVEKKV